MPTREILVFLAVSKCYVNMALQLLRDIDNKVTFYLDEPYDTEKEMRNSIEDGMFLEGERLTTTDSLDWSKYSTVIFPQLDVQPEKSDAEYAIMAKRLFG